jgi:hypothetical protein
VIIVAFSFSLNLFPIYENLKDKTNKKYRKGIKVSLIISLVIYCFMGINCVLLFGSSVANTSNILDNINAETKNINITLDGRI